MNKLKGIMFIALGLVIVGVVGGLLTFRSMNQSETISKEKVINEEFSKVKVISGAQVEILPTKDKAAKIELSGKKAKNTNVIFNTNVEGKTLKVELIDKQSTFFNFEFTDRSLHLKVLLPEKLYESINTVSNNGKVYLEGITSTDVFASTDNGMMELKNITGKKVKVKANNGRVSLYHVEGQLKGETDNGKISVVTRDMNRSIDLTSNNGRIDVQTEKEPTNVRFDVHVDNGRINIFNKYKDNAVIGNGEHVIHLTTDNGSINVSLKK